MKVGNSTVYETRSLRRLIIAVHNWMAPVIGHRARTWKRLRCEVRYSRNAYGDCTGVAYIGGSYMVVRLPKPGSRRRRSRHAGNQVPASAVDAPGARLPVLTASAANIVWHELMHIYGYRHDRIPKHPDSMFVWATEQFGERVPVCAPKPKPVVGPRDRLEHLDALESRWKTRLQFAQTRLETLGRKRKRYERALAKEQPTTVAEPTRPIAATPAPGRDRQPRARPRRRP